MPHMAQRAEQTKEILTDMQSAGDSCPATMEAAKRYRLYGQAVESLVIEVWPELNRDLLLNPDFGWIKAA